MSTRVKHIIKKLWSLPPKDREVWLEAIMGEFDEDFSHAKWREGYEQGKFDGAWVGTQLKDADKIRRELNRPIVPQFVADWIELYKKSTRSLLGAIHYAKGTDIERWLIPSDNQETFARAWLDGYEVEEEHKYNVKFKGISGGLNYLNYNSEIQKWYFASSSEIGMVRTKFTHEELEYAGFGEVFNSPLFEVEEVEG